MNTSAITVASDLQPDPVCGIAFGQRLKVARELKGASQVTIAAEARVAASYLSSIERGRRPAPTAAVVSRLVKALALDDEETAALTAAAARSRDEWHQATKKSSRRQGDAGALVRQQMSECLTQAIDAMRQGWCAGFEVIVPGDGQPVRLVMWRAPQTHRVEAAM